MKKLLVIFTAVLVTVHTHAQYAEVPLSDKLVLRGSTIVAGGVRLDKSTAAVCFSDVGGVDRSADYLKYRTGYKTGLGLTVGGAALMGGGVITTFGATLAALVIGIPKSLAGEETPGIDTALWVGVSSAALGTATLVSGIPVLCVYKKRLRNLVNERNVQKSDTGVALLFGGQSSGIGITLQF